LIIRRFILLFPGETGLFPTKAASSARDKVPDPSASIAATNARTSAGEASRFVIFKPVRNISSTSWTDNSPERSRSYFRKKRSSGREPHFALNAFLSLSCVFMSRGFLTVRRRRWVARLALVARRMVVLCCVALLLVARVWVGRGGGVRTPVGRGQPCGARGSPLPGQKVDGQRLAQELSGRLRRAFLGPCLLRGAFGKGMTPTGIDAVRRCNSIASWLVKSALASGR